MRLIKQPCSLKLEKVYGESCKQTNQRHGRFLPNTIRCIISGPSNCGKTNLIVGLLLHENGLNYLNVYLYSKTAFQPKYVFLENVLKKVPRIKFVKFHRTEDVVSLAQLEPNSVIIFDDVSCEKQNNIRDYFSMGRHKSADCFYLNQTYSKVPKQLIRDNANLIIIFRQDDVNLRHIYDEHVNTDLTWSQFREMCANIWKTPHDYLVINKDCEKNKGRYRKQFDTFVMFD